jgi:hypothetical protein
VFGLKRCEASTPWTTEEEALIRAGVEARERWRRIAEGLPGRTVGAVRLRGRGLGLRLRETKKVAEAVFTPWTAAEDDAIRAGVAAGEDPAEIAGRLPGRHGRMTRTRALQLGLKCGALVSPRWKAAEDEAVRSGVAAGESDVQMAVRLPGRSLCAIAGRKQQLEPTYKWWTKEEDAVLRGSLESGKSWGQIAEQLPGRTRDAVKRRGEGMRRNEQKGLGLEGGVQGEASPRGDDDPASA